MAAGIVTFISPKGYGMAKLEDGRFTFLPANLLSKKYRPSDKIEVEIVRGDVPDRFRAVSIIKT